MLSFGTRRALVAIRPRFTSAALLLSSPKKKIRKV